MTYTKEEAQKAAHELVELTIKTKEMNSQRLKVWLIHLGMHKMDMLKLQH